MTAYVGISSVFVEAGTVMTVRSTRDYAIPLVDACPF